MFGIGFLLPLTWPLVFRVKTAAIVPAVPQWVLLQITILPVQHLRCRLLEIVSESLLDIGASESGKSYADSLCLEITRDLTGQDLLVFAKETLQLEDFQKLRAFCAAHYPLLFAAIDEQSRQ